MLKQLPHSFKRRRSTSPISDDQHQRGVAWFFRIEIRSTSNVMNSNLGSARPDAMGAGTAAQHVASPSSRNRVRRLADPLPAARGSVTEVRMGQRGESSTCLGTWTHGWSASALAGHFGEATAKASPETMGLFWSHGSGKKHWADADEWAPLAATAVVGAQPPAVIDHSLHQGERSAGANRPQERGRCSLCCGRRSPSGAGHRAHTRGLERASASMLSAVVLTRGHQPGGVQPRRETLPLVLERPGAKAF